MRDDFEIRSPDGDCRLLFSGDLPRDLSGYDGCSYQVMLKGEQVSASATVYDIQPHRWSEFFDDLSDNWRGWQEPKSHESLEGHLHISATSDSLGHVSLRIVVRDDFSGSNWRAEHTLFLEAGQLEHIAKDAHTFFG